eukprot:scaffold8497_cov111-Isochrysis_galbana.AAC.1
MLFWDKGKDDGSEEERRRQVADRVDVLAVREGGGPVMMLPADTAGGERGAHANRVRAEGGDRDGAQLQDNLELALQLGRKEVGGREFVIGKAGRVLAGMTGEPAIARRAFVGVAPHSQRPSGEESLSATGAARPGPSRPTLLPPRPATLHAPGRQSRSSCRGGRAAPRRAPSSPAAPIPTWLGWRSRGPTPLPADQPSVPKAGQHCRQPADRAHIVHEKLELAFADLEHAHAQRRLHIERARQQHRHRLSLRADGEGAGWKRCIEDENKRRNGGRGRG